MIEEKYEFARASGQAIVFLTWLPEEKRKGVPTLRLFDLDNHLIIESAGKKKITVTANRLSYSARELDLSKLSPGVYRVDVLLDADTVWRTFFRMVD